MARRSWALAKRDSPAHVAAPGLSFRGRFSPEESLHARSPLRLSIEERFSGFRNPVGSTGFRKPDLASLGMTALCWFPASNLELPASALRVPHPSRFSRRVGP